MMGWEMVRSDKARRASGLAAVLLGTTGLTGMPVLAYAQDAAPAAPAAARTAPAPARTAAPASTRAARPARGVAPASAAELRAAETKRSKRDDTGTGSDPLAEVVASGDGSDAAAGDYLND